MHKVLYKLDCKNKMKNISINLFNNINKTLIKIILLTFILKYYFLCKYQYSNNTVCFQKNENFLTK